jgi:hypothetical protein
VHNFGNPKIHQHGTLSTPKSRRELSALDGSGSRASPFLW